MSTRSRKLREQNEVVKLVKDLTKKMGDFETAVSELKILKESLLDMNEQVETKQNENKELLKQLELDLQANKTKMLKQAADDTDKVLISKDELQELQDEVEKLKETHAKTLSQSKAEFDTKLAKQVEQELKIQKLQHDCATASLT